MLAKHKPLKLLPLCSTAKLSVSYRAYFFLHETPVAFSCMFHSRVLNLPGLRSNPFAEVVSCMILTTESIFFQHCFLWTFSTCDIFRLHLRAPAFYLSELWCASGFQAARGNHRRVAPGRKVRRFGLRLFSSRAGHANHRHEYGSM